MNPDNNPHTDSDQDAQNQTAGPESSELAPTVRPTDEDAHLDAEPAHAPRGDRRARPAERW
jgi:hypothetical protein